MIRIIMIIMIMIIIIVIIMIILILISMMIMLIKNEMISFWKLYSYFSSRYLSSYFHQKCEASGPDGSA